MTTKPAIPRGISVNAFAEAVDLHPETVRDQIRDGIVPHYRIGRTIRIPLSFLEDKQREAYAEKVVANMPALTAAQIAKLTALLDVD
jgi:excisionase family DNA binding protein